MLNEIKEFLIYLKEVKSISRNTELSYERDLRYLAEFLNKKGIFEWKKVTVTILQSYLIFLEKEGKSPATISRILASIKAFFHYALVKKIVENDPTQSLRSPKIKKRQPKVMTIEEVELLLRQPSQNIPKEIRDRAMLELLYATGLRVTEILSLQISDLNMTLGYITCKEKNGVRSIPFGERVKNILKTYLADARPQLLYNEKEKTLFVNCMGRPMSRQGFWKLVKFYVKKAGIQKEVTPHMLRHSFAMHLIANGANLKEIQETLGYSDLSVIQLYANLMQSGKKHIYELDILSNNEVTT